LLRPSSLGVPAGVEWLAALLFAVHPVAVESVAWISEQKNTLSLLFYLLAALAYLDFDASRRRRSYALALGFFLLALGTKTVTATLPAALLVILWWKRGRLDWRRDVAPLVPWLALGIGAGLFTAWDERTLMGAAGSAYTLTAAQRVLLGGRVIWFYLGKLLWPADLMFVYPRWDVAAAAPGWFGWVLGSLVVTAGLWLLRRRSRTPLARAASAGLACWLFYCGSLFPALGFFNVFPFLYSYVADHFQCQASLGIFALAAAGLAGLEARSSGGTRIAARVLCALPVAALALLTHDQSRTYRDSETLYRATIAQNPACWMAHNNLGADLAGQPGRGPEALEHYQAALRIRPDYPEAHNNLGNLLATMPGQAAEALAHYEAALRLKPDFSEAHDNLANLLATLPGRADEALAHYEQALRLKPDNVDALYNLAGLLATRPGREAEAVAHYQAVIRLQPDYVDAYNNLAILYARQGLVDEAIKIWEQALQIDPNYATARTNLQGLRERLGR
jgi:tetratricopeptide (TPR) repeat protein